jgi:serine/threonine-protein kinase RsbW
MAVTTDEDFDLRRYSLNAFQKRFRFDLSAKVEAINPAVDAAMRFAHENGCVGECEFEVRLALQEALANAVLHGCKCDRGQTVHGLIACEDSRLLVVVRDPGHGFDADLIPCPTDEHRLLEAHGRGIELMRRLMDEVYFMRGGTEVHMIKHRPPAERENLEMLDE